MLVRDFPDDFCPENAVCLRLTNLGLGPATSMEQDVNFGAFGHSNGSAGNDAARGRRLCLIEDVAQQRGSDREGLARLGFRVEAYSVAEDGLNALLREDFDAAIVNFTAPAQGMGGPELIRLIRSCGHPQRSQLPVIAVVSAKQLGHGAKFVQLGVSDVMADPLDLSQLESKLKALCGPQVQVVEPPATALKFDQIGRPDLGGQYLESGSKREPLAPTQTQRVTDSAWPNDSVVVAMKQKQNPLQGASIDSLDGEKRGLLERWGDKILQRLAKSQDEELSSINVQSTGVPSVGAREKAISDALKNLGQPPASRQMPAAVSANPTPKSVPPSPSPKAVRESVRVPVARPAQSPVRPAASSPRPVAQVSATKKTYVSPVNWRGSTSARPAPKAPAVARKTSAVASAGGAGRTTASDVKLTPAEKNKVYERVRNLISTAREGSDDDKTPRKRISKTLRVCFLEDSCTSSHAIREMLGESGHEVDHFSIPEEALDALKEKEYDLLLASEVETIGTMDCHALIRALRASTTVKNSLPIIVLTANGDRDNIRAFIASGANEVIVKPVDGKKLNDQIQTVVTVQRMPVRATKKSLNVCFLEDSCTSSHAIREMLGEAGHQVDHFSSAEEALDALSEKKYDVLLASQIVALGGMDCEGLVATLRRSTNPRARSLPIVVITANSDPRNLEKFYLAGSSDVVVKPVEGNELNARIRDVVRSASGSTPVVQPAINFKICFLEDSCTSSHAIREMLGNEGHEVDHFSSAEEALDALMEKNYDVLLSSQIVALGGMDCIGLLRTIRTSKNPAKRALPVVVITANADPSNIESFFQSGANDVIVKPIEGKMLNQRISQTVTTKRETPEISPPSAPRNLRVCFLEDSCTSSHAIREMLGEAGHEVDHFSTTEEALDAFGEKDYDLLLASQIPTIGGMDTEALVRTIRGAGKRQKPIVVLTTDASTQNRVAFQAAGANHVLIKPVKPDLSDKLRAVVEGRSEVPARIPAAGSAPAAAKAPAPAPVRVPKFLKVCFLEDSCTSSHAIREMLGESGHEVDHFSSPEEALDALMEKRYDVLLASQIVALGGLDCEGLITTVRSASKKDRQGMPIVAITANGEPANLQVFRNAGADDVVVKPIEGNLGERLKTVIRTRPPGGRRPNLRVVGSKRSQATALPSAPSQPQPSLQDALTKLGKPASAQQPNAPAAQPRKQAPPPPAKGLSLSDLLDSKPSPLPAPAVAERSSLDRKIIFGLVGIGIFAVVASTWHHFGEHVPVSVVTADAGSIFDSISAPGRVESKRKVNLTTSMPGQITKVVAKEGDKVRRGDVLASLDERTAAIELQRAQARLESAKREVALTERTLDRLVRALQMGAVSRQMAEDAEAAVHASRAKQRVAQEEVNAAQLAAERLNITAPFDGTVTVSYAVEGLWAEPPGPLFTIVDMGQREVEVRVATEDSARLSVGQPVALTSDAFPGQQWNEQIVRIAPAASRETGTGNTVSVYISLGPDSPPLRYGQQVDAQIRTSMSNNTVRVPYNAITVRNGRSMVAVIDEGRAHFIPVVTGIESNSHVEILEGLRAGQEVIVITNEVFEGAAVEAIEIHG